MLPCVRPGRVPGREHPGWESERGCSVGRAASGSDPLQSRTEEENSGRLRFRGGHAWPAGVKASRVPAGVRRPRPSNNPRCLKQIHGAGAGRTDGVRATWLPRADVRTDVTPYPLAQANEALAALREGRVRGAAVLVP